MVVTAQAVGAEGGGDMQLPMATGAIGALGLCGSLAAAASALWRRR